MSTLKAKVACARTYTRAPDSPLHTITKRHKRGRRYCGPSAVCIVTGAEYGQVTRLIREKIGKRAVMGTSTSDLVSAFHALGWRLDDLGPDEDEPRQTLARWARDRSPGDRSVYLINVTRHWVVVVGDEAADSKTGGPVPLADFGRLRKRVRRVYSVRPGTDHRSMLESWVWDEWRLTKQQRMIAAIRRNRGDYPQRRLALEGSSSGLRHRGGAAVPEGGLLARRSVTAAPPRRHPSARAGPVAKQAAARARAGVKRSGRHGARRPRRGECGKCYEGVTLMETGLGWELGRDGKHLSIPIRPHDADVVREWCAAHCEGDFLLVLGRRIVFERRDDAAFATLYWRAEGD